MSNALKLFGTIFWIAAAYLLYEGWIMDVTVANESGLAGIDRIANLQLIHIQAMTLNLGMCAGIIGTMLECTAALIDAWKKQP